MRAPRPGGRALLGAAALLLGLALALVACQAVGADGDGATADPAATATAQVTRRDIAEQLEVSGTLGYGDEIDVALDGGGVLTALPALGTVVDRGGTVVEVDGRAVPLWFGDRPLWRELDASSSDGLDIREVEENLVALGFDPDERITVDDEWDWATTAAVKRWQKAGGLDQTGSLAPGDVVVLPGAVRVAGHPAAVGARVGGPVVAVTEATRQVDVDLDATKRSLVTEGDAVEVVLPGGRVVAGAVTTVGTVAESPQDGDPLNPSDPTISVVVALDGSAAIEGLDAAPVKVRITAGAATDVLAVPVDALLALAEGGYAVERRTASGTELVAVTTGAFASGWVEVSGDLAEGDEVVVPA